MWRSIDSAPRDGSLFLGTGLDQGKGPGRHYALTRFSRTTGRFHEDPNDFSNLCHLDYWMPIPALDIPSGG